MKNIIILALIVAGVYAVKPELFPFLTAKGAFDEQGRPQVLVFTHDKCGKYCADAKRVIKNRHIQYTEYKLDGNETNQALWKKYGGVNSFPNIIVGNEKFYGSDKSGIVSVLALNYGDTVLNSSERYYMKKHFNDDGSEKLVIYGSSRCGYCIKLRQALDENKIDYLDIDVEKSSKRKSMTRTLNISGFPLVYYGYKRMPGPKPDDVLAMF